MARTPERAVKDKVRKILTDMGAYLFMPATHGYGKSGVPDIVGCYQGIFFAIECTAGKGKTTALQERELNLIRSAGGVSFVVNEENLDEVEKTIILHADRLVRLSNSEL